MIASNIKTQYQYAVLCYHIFEVSSTTSLSLLGSHAFSSPDSSGPRLKVLRAATQGTLPPFEKNKAKKERKEKKRITMCKQKIACVSAALHW